MTAPGTARTPEAIRLLLAHAQDIEAPVILKCVALDGEQYEAAGYVQWIGLFEVSLHDDPTPVRLDAIDRAIILGRRG